MINALAIINYFSLTAEQFDRLTDQQMNILSYIYEFGSISPMEAFVDLGVTKLATRISEMRVLGISFDQNYEDSKNRYGKKVHYMRYRKAAA